jgi:hypothetical protein
MTTGRFQAGEACLLVLIFAGYSLIDEFLQIDFQLNKDSKADTGKLARQGNYYLMYQGTRLR